MAGSINRQTLPGCTTLRFCGFCSLHNSQLAVAIAQNGRQHLAAQLGQVVKLGVEGINQIGLLHTCPGLWMPTKWSHWMPLVLEFGGFSRTYASAFWNQVDSLWIRGSLMFTLIWYGKVTASTTCLLRHTHICIMPFKSIISGSMRTNLDYCVFPSKAVLSRQAITICHVHLTSKHAKAPKQPKNCLLGQQKKGKHISRTLPWSLK